MLFTFLLTLFGAPFLQQPAATLDQGRDLYLGKLPLSARLAGEADLLPAFAASCVQCHGKSGRGTSEAGVDVADISWSALSRSQPRRGNRPSQYSPQVFCRALTHGLDPLGQTLSRAMPRFDISTSSCNAIWGYLQQISESSPIGVTGDSIPLAVVSRSGSEARRRWLAQFTQAIETFNRKGGAWGRSIALRTSTVIPPESSIVILLDDSASRSQPHPDRTVVIRWHEGIRLVDLSLPFTVEPTLDSQASALLLKVVSGKLLYFFTAAPASSFASAVRHASSDQGLDFQVVLATVPSTVPRCESITGGSILLDLPPTQAASVLAALAGCPLTAPVIISAASLPTGWSPPAKPPLLVIFPLPPASGAIPPATTLAQTLLEAIEESGRKFRFQNFVEALESAWKKRSGEEHRLFRGAYAVNVNSDSVPVPGIWLEP